MGEHSIPFSPCAVVAYPPAVHVGVGVWEWSPRSLDRNSLTRVDRVSWRSGMGRVETTFLFLCSSSFDFTISGLSTVQILQPCPAPPTTVCPVGLAVAWEEQDVPKDVSVTQWVKRLTLSFSSGSRGHGIEPHVTLHTQNHTLRFSLSLSPCPSSFLSLFLSNK